MTASVRCLEDARREKRIIKKSVIMKVKLPSGKTEKIEITSIKVEKLLHLLSINPSSVIVVMDGQIISEDSALCNEDELQIIRVVYGG